jgi:hypothetical protein
MSLQARVTTEAISHLIDIIEIATQHAPGKLFTVVPPNALLGVLTHHNDK